MSGEENHTWHEANQAYLVGALAEVRRVLERRVGWETKPINPPCAES